MSYIIRPVIQSDLGRVARLAFETYYKRFFCTETINARTGKPYGGPLAAEFPELATGQNLQWFSDYWTGFMPGLTEPDPLNRNYAFVAECRESRKILAFIKGDGKSVEGNLYNDLKQAGLIQGVANDEICELGSIYIDFEEQRRGLGRSLTQRYAQAMYQLGYKDMVTRAYAKNDSPDFFRKMGACGQITCTIPNGYYDSNGQKNSVDIPGICLVWTPQNFKKLAAVNDNRPSVKPSVPRI